MSNHLEMAMIHAIVQLREQGWSARRIARELGINRETVGRHMAAACVKPATPAANPPPGSAALGEGLETSKPATALPNPPPGAAAVPAAAASVPTGPPSVCAPYRALILEKLEQGLSGQRIYQDLGAGGTGPSYDSVKRFLRHLRKTTPVPFRRMEVPPGQEMQVDFGTGAPVTGADGRRRRTYVFRLVLSYSRKAYSEVVYRQTTEDFIACLENAFQHFGGVTRTVVIDNLRAAVKQPDWYDPELTPRLEAFCAHYGIVILPTKAYTPRHKGKVERGVAYVQDNALKGRRFADLAAQNQYLREWEKGVADTRIHGTTRQHVGQIFEQVERPALLPLPAERFPFFHEELRTVHRDGHVAVAQAYYSVPPEYMGRPVWVRWDAHLVKIFNHRREPLAVHVRQEPGRFATAAAHVPQRKTSAVEKGASWLLEQTSRLGPQVGQWAEQMLATRGIPGVRVLVGLLALAKRHAPADLDRACQIAASHQTYRLRGLRELLQESPGEVGLQTAMEFIQTHPLIRSLGEYDALVHDAFCRSETSAPGERP